MSLLLAGIGAGVSAIGSLVGGLVDRKKEKKRQKRLDENQNTLDKWHNQQMSKDYLDDKSAKATLKLLQNRNKEQAEALANTMVRNNSTQESKVATASALNSNLADATLKLSSQADAAKEQQQQSYIAQSNNIEAQRNSRTNSAGTYIAGAANILGNAATMLNGEEGIKIPRRKK